MISRRIEGDLAHGNELLAARNPNYPVAEKGPVLGYDLDAIEAVLRPYGGSEFGLGAFESFAGYLTFDALIGNTDRHHENWAVIRNDHCLAPTYDHADPFRLSLGGSQRYERCWYCCDSPSATRALRRLLVRRFGVQAPGDPLSKPVAAQPLSELQRENDDWQIGSLAHSSSAYG